MASFPNQEHRPLKRLRLGPIGPEVYPQDKKQKEVNPFVWKMFLNQLIMS